MTTLRRLAFSAAIAAAALAATAAQGAVIFQDDFDSENGGATVNNYAGLTNWQVSDGTVDIKAGDNTRGTTGLGAYLDLDGTSYNGGSITTIDSFAFGEGDLVTLTFLASGNQIRPGMAADDSLEAGFKFAGTTLIRNFTLGGAFGSQNLGDLTAPTAATSSLTPYDSGWQSYSISFRAGEAGTLQAFLGTGSKDNYGPMVDNVILTIASVVPEPATWAMMILGFGWTGSALRRRREALRFSAA